MIAEAQTHVPRRSPLPSSFHDWRSRLDRERIVPVLAVAGSKGKTSVVRAVESILRSGGFRFASWTDHGVEIEGERQRGELGPWSRALTRLAAGGLDVALQELDWTTVPAVGASGTRYPIAAIANLCGNSEACTVTPETLQARRALSIVKSSVASLGRLVVNADDFALSADPDDADYIDRYLVGISPDAPVLRRHLQQDGNACWLDDLSIVVREGSETRAIARVDQLPSTRSGTIQFTIQNALIATAVARCCGISDRVIAAGLMGHEPRPESMPGSFNLFETPRGTLVVDRPAPSWFLRTSIRACANLGTGRQIRVAGPMANVATGDLVDVGRLLGRNGGVLVAHGEWPDERLDQLRQGAASNPVPPIFLQAKNERTAVQQALDMLRATDVMLILAEDPSATIDLIQRRLRRAAPDQRENPVPAKAS